MDRILSYIYIIPKCMIVYLIDIIPTDYILLWAPPMPSDSAAWLFWLDVLKGLLFIVFTAMAIASMPLLRKLISMRKGTKKLFKKVDTKEELSE